MSSPSKQRHFLDCEYLIINLEQMQCSKNSYATCKASRGQRCGRLYKKSLSTSESSSYTQEDIVELLKTFKDYISSAEYVDEEYTDCVDVNILRRASGVVNQLLLCVDDLQKHNLSNESLLAEKDAVIQRIISENPGIQKELSDKEAQTVKDVFQIVQDDAFAKGMDYVKKSLEDKYKINL